MASEHAIRSPLWFFVVPLLFGACGPDAMTAADGSTGPIRTSDVSEFQAEILRDGLVDPAEYERAVYATVECLRDAGVVVSDPAWTPDGRFFMYTYLSEEPNGPAVVANDTCFALYLSEVQTVHTEQTKPTEEELRVQAAEYAACLRSEGVLEAEDGMTVQELQVLAADAASSPECISPLAIVVPRELVEGPSGAP